MVAVMVAVMAAVLDCSPAPVNALFVFMPPNTFTRHADLAMEVAAPPAVVQSIFEQLQLRNAQHCDAFSDVVADYQHCLQRCRELQVCGHAI